MRITTWSTMLLQTILSITSLVVLGTALPAPPPPPGARKVTAIPAFNVTGFTASAVVLSHRVYYHFNVTFCPDLPPMECSVLGTTLSEDLSSTPLTKCGSGPVDADDPRTPDVSFQWTREDDGTSNLLITRTVGIDGRVVEEAEYLVPSNHTQNVGEGRFRHMVYEGPENFSVPAFRFEVA